LEKDNLKFLRLIPLAFWDFLTKNKKRLIYFGRAILLGAIFNIPLISLAKHLCNKEILLNSNGGYICCIFIILLSGFTSFINYRVILTIKEEAKDLT